MSEGKFFAQAGIEAEEGQRRVALVSAISAFAEARRRAASEWRSSSEGIRIDFDFDQFPVVYRSELRSYEMVTTMLSFFDEQRSALSLWKHRATEIFFACLRDLVQYLANMWNQMDLDLDFYVPIQNPFDQSSNNYLPLLNILLWRMNGFAHEEFITGNSADLAFRDWDSTVGFAVYKLGQNANDDAKAKPINLEKTWAAGIRGLDSCFLRTIISGNTDGRIGRALATRLNAETARIRDTVNRFQTSLNAARNQPEAAPQAEVADVKMREVNPSLQLSAFGRQIIPITFKPAEPAAMDISKFGGFCSRFYPRRRRNYRRP